MTPGKKFIFEVLKKLTVNGTFEVIGSSDNYIILDPAGMWDIDVKGGSNVNFVMVENCNNVGTPIIISTGTIVNSTGWAISSSGTGVVGVKDPNVLPLWAGPIATQSGTVTNNINIDLGDQDDETKYNKKYKKGKYRTVVIVYEGVVVEAPYTSKGPERSQQKTLKQGQRTSRVVEIL
jgi:hypothetical protein